MSRKKALRERLQKLEDEINVLIELQAAANRAALSNIQPDTAQSVVVASNTAQPVVAASNTAQPIVAASNIGQPIVIASNTAQPTVAASNTAEPVVAVSNTAQPVVAVSNTAQPVVATKGRQMNTFNRECAACPCSKNRSCAGQPVKPSTDTKLFRYDKLSCFLQNINYNLAKGTEAISKIAGFAELTHIGCRQSNDTATDKTHLFYGQMDEHQQGFTKCNFLLNERTSYNNFRKIWNKNDEINSLYKELRDEKDKRQRAENQIKSLKVEMKKFRADVEQEYEMKNKYLSQQFKEEQTKLYEKINFIERKQEENIVSEFKWRDKYETVLKDLSCEREKCFQFEKHIEELKAALVNRNSNNSQDIQRKLHILKDTNLKLQDELNCISLAKHKVSIKNEELKAQLQSKENSLFFCKQKLEQLTNICEKLREKILALKEKVDQAEHRLECKEKIIITLSNRYLLNETQMKEEIVSREAQYKKGCSEWMDREKVLQEKLNQLSEKHKVLEHEYTKREEKHQYKMNRLKEHVDLLTVSSKAESDKNKQLIEELSNAVDNFKTQTDVLTQSNKKQENEIASLKETLKSKEEQVRLSFNEVIACRQQLEESRQTKSDWQQGDVMNKGKDQDIQQLKQQLQEEKDKLLIKDKIIEDHIKTIQNMKESAGRREDIVKIERERYRLERMLNDQERKNEQLTETVHDLRHRKEELKDHILELENELQKLRLQPELAKKQMEVLRNLEKEVENKHKEWTQKIETITKEKDNAIETAKYSTQKLTQALHELDEVSRRYKQLEEIVSKLEVILKNKETLLDEKRSKVSALEDELQKQKESSQTKLKYLETKLRKACEVCTEGISDVQLHIVGKD